MRQLAVLMMAAFLLTGYGGESTGGVAEGGALAIEVEPGAGIRADEETIEHPCTGESILFTGGFNATFHSVFNPAGGFLQVVHVNPQGLSGVGADGTRYRAVGSSTQVLLVTPGSAEVHTVNDVFNIIAEGPGPDFQIHTLTHVTVDGNGETTAEIGLERTSCR